MSMQEILADGSPATAEPSDTIQGAPRISSSSSIAARSKPGNETESSPVGSPGQDALAHTEEPAEFSEDSVDLVKTADGFIDHNSIYEQLQERFSRAYSLSQKLFVTEKTQRQALYHYKRRVNALLDVLQDMEDTESADVDQPLEIDHSRLTSLITWRPELASTLNPVLQLAAGTDSPAQIPLKRSYAVNLVVEESIPEIANDESDAVEINPQNTEMWIRRNLSHLIMSKFTPAEVTPKGVREYSDPLPMGSKRKKRS